MAAAASSELQQQLLRSKSYTSIMATQSVTRQLLRTSLRRSCLHNQTRAYSRIRSNFARDQLLTPALYFTLPAPRLFQTSAQNAAVKLPDSGEAPEPEAHEEPPSQKTEITTEEYHQRADEFLDALVSKLEARQEAKGDLDAEYSVSSSSSCMVKRTSTNKNPGRRIEH